MATQKAIKVVDRNQVEIEKQSKLNGFELFTIKEWLDYV